jgi:hypothetical protein
LPESEGVDSFILPLNLPVIPVQTGIQKKLDGKSPVKPVQLSIKVRFDPNGAKLSGGYVRVSFGFFCRDGAVRGKGGVVW